MLPPLIEYLEKSGRLKVSGSSTYPYYYFSDLNGFNGSIDYKTLMEEADAWSFLKEEDLPMFLLTTTTWVSKHAARMWLAGVR